MIHKGRFVGFLTSTLSDSALLLNDVYCLQELSYDEKKEMGLINRDGKGKLEGIIALFKSHGIVIKSSQEFYETKSRELFEEVYRGATRSTDYFFFKGSQTPKFFQK